MEKKFDVTLKSLLEDSPEDWPILAGVHEAKVEVIDADVSTISGAADKVLCLQGPPLSLMHFEFQAGPDVSLPRRVNLYNAALEDRHDLPAASVVVLLRPQANLSVLTGIYQRQMPHASEPYRMFRYQVVRVWELPVQSLLQGGLGLLALAPVIAVGEAELPNVLREMKRQVARVPDRGRLGRWWTAVFVLMGMRYGEALINQLLQGVLGMKESVTYQAIVREGLAQGLVQGRSEGALEEARKMLLRLGQAQFQTPPPAETRSGGIAVRTWGVLPKGEFRTSLIYSVSKIIATAAEKASAIWE